MSERDERIARIERMLRAGYKTGYQDTEWLLAELRSAQRALDDSEVMAKESRSSVLELIKRLRMYERFMLEEFGSISCDAAKAEVKRWRDANGYFATRADAPAGSTDLTRNPDGSVRMSTDFPGQPFGPGDTITFAPTVPSRETSEPAGPRVYLDGDTGTR